MTLIATAPDLVLHAAHWFLEATLHSVAKAAARGARAIWIEECMLDMIHPDAFASMNLPLVRELVEAIRAAGMKSVYYYCGDPTGKWDLIFSAGADAVAFEEGKKGFQLDIDEVVQRVGGRCVVLGNLDAVAVLQNGTEQQLRDEIARQIDAGKRNGSRFIMSIGSPVTPDTPIDRVRLYCDTVREIGQG